MTFEEYINQEDPKRQHGVEVRESDCHKIYPCVGGKQIILRMFNKEYSYMLTEENNILRVFDEDGNPTKYSCFQFIS